MEVSYSCAAGIRRRRPCCGGHRQVQLPSFLRNGVQRWGLTLFVVAPLVLFGLGLAVLSVVRILGRHSLTEIAGVSIVGIVVLSVLSLWERWASSLRAFMGKRWRSSQPGVRILCLFTFFPVFSIYFLTGGEVRSVPATLEVGVIAVAAALGGLVLNAGLNLGGEKGREFILVAQKFIAVVILMLIFLPTLHLVDLAGDIDIASFEPGNPTAWGRGVMFWISAASFYAGAGLFVIALVDLAYAVFGLGGSGNASRRKCELPDRNNQCDGCGDTGDSGSSQP